MAGVTVKLSKVLPDDQLGGVSATGSDAGIYDDYTITMTYSHHDHVLQLPLANSNSTVSSVFVQVAKPEGSLRVDWIAERNGGKPLCPLPYMNNTNYTYLHGEIRYLDPELTSGSAIPRIRIAGTYFFGHSNRDLMSIVPGVPPWLDQTIVKGGELTTNDFSPDILEAALGQSGINAINAIKGISSDSKQQLLGGK